MPSQRTFAVFVLAMAVFSPLLASTSAQTVDPAIPSCSSLGINLTTTFIGHNDLDNSLGPLWYDAIENTEVPDLKRQVMVTTKDDRLVRSLTGGRDWLELTNALPGVGSPNTNTGKYGVANIFMDSQGTMIYAVGYGSRVWVTADGGQAWSFGELPDNRRFYKQYIQVHPLKPTWIAALAGSPCCDLEATCSDCSYDLYVSTSRGQSWTLIERYIDYINTPTDDKTRYWWGVGPSTGFDWDPNYFLAYSHFTIKTGDTRAFYYNLANVPWELHVHSEFVLLRNFNDTTTDTTTEPRRIATIDYADGFAWTKAALFVYQVSPFGKILYTSKDSGFTLTRAFIEDPLDWDGSSTVTVYSQKLVSTPQDGGVMIGIGRYVSNDPNNATRGEPWYYDGDIYVSDLHAPTHWGLILKTAVYESEVIDFEDMGSTTPYIVLANQYLTRNDIRFKTQISFNRGISWNDLAVPDLLECAGLQPNQKCTLNLVGNNGAESQNAPMPKWKSNPSAPGFIFANGITSASVETNNGAWPNGVRPFVSADGGLTWKRVQSSVGNFTRPAVFEIAAHGSLLVTAPYNTPTDELYFSKDDGNTWAVCSMADDAEISALPGATVDVVDSFSDPLNNVGAVVLLATAMKDGQRGYFFIHADFTATYTSSCQIVNDYHDWKPPQLTDCVDLGATVPSYTRRNLASSECLDDLYMDRTPHNYSPCECTDLDYICDVCFMPKSQLTSPMHNTTGPRQQDVCLFNDLACSDLAIQTVYEEVTCSSTNNALPYVDIFVSGLLRSPFSRCNEVTAPAPIPQAAPTAPTNVPTAAPTPFGTAPTGSPETSNSTNPLSPGAIVAICIVVAVVAAIGLIIGGIFAVKKFRVHRAKQFARFNSQDDSRADL